MKDKFVKIIYFSGNTPPAAEFEHAWPVYACGFNDQYYLETHFRLNLDSLRTRMHNLTLPKNGAPHDLSQEQKALPLLASATLSNHV